MSVISNNTLAGSSGQGGGGGYAIERSLRFNSSDSANLSRTPSSSSNRNKYTWSGWVKRCQLGSTTHYLFFAKDGSNVDFLAFEADSIMWYNAFSGGVTSTDKFRDPSAWYHVVFSVDSTQATTTDRVKIYVNNRQITSFSSSLYPSHNRDFAINHTVAHSIGSYDNTYSSNFYLADINLIDGQALSATDFGEYDDNNVWQPKKYGGTFGPSVDQSQTWSSAITGTYNGSNDADNLFDGNTSNQTIPATGTSLTFTPSSAVTGITKIRIKLSCDPLHTDEFKVNGVDQTSTLIKDSVTRDLDYSASQLTSIVWSTSSNNHWIALKQISVEVNGSWVVLVDSSVTIPNNSFLLDFSDTSSNAALGTDSSGNSNTWTVNNLNAAGLDMDQSQTWSTYGSPSSGGFALAASRGFDGNTANQTEGDTTGAYFSIPYSATVAVGGVGFFTYASGSSGKMKVYNGATLVETVDSSTGGSWRYTSSYSGAITEIRISRDSRAFEFSAVSVNGKVLVDAGVPDPLGANIDALRDSPVNGDSANDTGAGGEITGNYATLNPLAKGASATLSNGNLDISSGAAWESTYGTIGVTSGKWYWEQAMTTSTYTYTGIDDNIITTNYPGNTSTSWAYLSSDGSIYNNNGAIVNIGAMPAGGGIIGIALDLDNRTLSFSINGVFANSADPATNSNPHVSNLPIGKTWFPSVDVYSTSAAMNFGQRAFAYAAPSGYKALCTANLPDPTIADGSTAFDTKTFTANNGTQTISGFNFSPDLVWTKSRANAYEHQLWDQVRGANKALMPNATSVEANLSGSLAFTSDGFTSNTNNNANYGSGGSVAWAWDAGSSNTTIAAGGLNSSVYNQSAVWSGMCSPAPSSGTYVQGFDGNLTSTFAGGISAGSYFTFTPTGGISFSNTIRVYNGAVANASYKYNGGSATSFPPNSWTTVASGGGTMTTFAVTRSVTDVHGWYAIEVDGKLLVDQGLSVSNVPSIASTVRANPSAGFSIVSYTGSSSATTVGHGLNAAPQMIIVKDRDNAYNWQVNHIGIGVDESLLLNSTPAAADYNAWNNNRPTSSVFSLGAGTLGVNTNGADLIAYCFAPVSGYSSFGVYTGAGTATGPFQYLGFRPRWIMIKRTDSSSTFGWWIWDTARNPYNAAPNTLNANTNGSELTNSSTVIDIFSNGFSPNGTGTSYVNLSGATYIYAAFAEHPFKTSRAR